MYIKDKKIIISAAITGATHVPSLSKYLPKNPDEIICSAIEAWRAGAAVVHIHARAQDGKPTTDHGGENITENAMIRSGHFPLYSLLHISGM